ncbi:MAG: NAD-dependent epimerase/dehydratase family protein [Chitinophagales bacterium]|nr:NAD-dependent epimerase/dehydratase family protein [Chitinophagales bacterium]
MVFVTGGTGFIGTYLLRELLQQGQNVRALKRYDSVIDLEDHLANQIEWVVGDVLDISSLEEAMVGCEKVYHCAAMVSFLSRDRKAIIKVNAEGTENVVNAALENKVKKFVHLSSVAALGRDTDSNLFTEDAKWEDGINNSNYAISKHLAEREVWRGAAEGLKVVIVNPSMVIGSGNWNKSTPRLFLDTWKGLPAYTSGGVGIICAEDVSALMFKLMESHIENERFVLNAENWKLKDFFFRICRLLGKEPPRLNASYWITEIIWRIEALKSIFLDFPPLNSKETSRMASHDSFSDNSKILEALPYRFKPVDSCIIEICQRFLQSITDAKVNHLSGKDFF